MTIQFGDLWVDVPIGPLVTSVSESWKTTSGSPLETEKEKNFSSAPKDGFVPVLSNSAKRRVKAATRTSRVATYDQHVHVHKALSRHQILARHVVYFRLCHDIIFSSLLFKTTELDDI
jgi:hypothetical protein